MRAHGHLPPHVVVVVAVVRTSAEAPRSGSEERTRTDWEGPCDTTGGRTVEGDKKKSYK